jgi:tetratricopeptide (TPR) repeat protein
VVPVETIKNSHAPTAREWLRTVLAILIVLLLLWPQPLAWVYLNLGSIEANRYLAGQEGAIALRAADENLTAAASMGVIRAYRQLGRLQFRRGDFDSAGQSLEHWVVLHPEDELGHWDLGKIYEAQGNRPAAIAEWQNAEAFHYLMRLGDEEAERGRWYQAIDLYHAAAEIAATRSNRVLAQRWDYVVERGWEAHQRLGSALWRGLGDVEGAVRQYEWAAILAPWNLNLLTDVAGQFEAIGDWDAAENWLQKALMADPTNPDTMTLLALNRVQAGDPVAGARWARQALLEDPARAAASIALGRALIASHDDAGAASVLQQAVDAGVTTPEVYAWLAAARRLSGQTQAAEAAYRASLSLRPNDTETLRSLASLLSEQGRWNEAISTLEAAVRSHPDTLDARLDLGGLYAQVGRKGEARDQYEFAKSIAPSDARAIQGLEALEEPAKTEE